MSVELPQPNADEVRAQPQLVRNLIFDRTLEDNPLEMDLEFSDEEIGAARQLAVIMFNSIPPFILPEVSVNNVPKQYEYPMLLATAYHLLLGKMMALSRKNVDYTAGGMNANLVQRQLEFLSKWAPLFKVESSDAVRQIKVVANRESVYMHFW